MEKYFGVLHYRNKKSKLKRKLKGPPGVGFKQTNYGNFDIDNKKLVNVNKPEDDKDVVVYSLFVKSMNELIKNLADLGTRLESLRTDTDDGGEYMEEVKTSVRLNTAALEAFKNEEKILNDFVRLNMYNKVFTGVARNISVTVLGNTVEFEEEISFNIKILKKNDKNDLAFSNEGYYRLTVLLYCSIKLNLRVFIKLFGNSLTNLIAYKHLLSLEYMNRRDVLLLNSLTLPFYTPKDDFLSIVFQQDALDKVSIDVVRIIIERIN